VTRSRLLITHQSHLFSGPRWGRELAPSRGATGCTPIKHHRRPAAPEKRFCKGWVRRVQHQIDPHHFASLTNGPGSRRLHDRERPYGWGRCCTGCAGAGRHRLKKNLCGLQK